MIKSADFIGSVSSA